MRFSCIIPAYNEWPRIEKVLETVLACPELEEIVVVNDGSTDNTREIIDRYTHPKLHKIHLENNGGKAKAILEWVKHSTWAYIVMIDSDLLHLTPEHIAMLMKPIQEEETDVTLSIRENSLPIYRFLWTDFVSGERVLPRNIFDDAYSLTTWPGFGLEVKLNRKIIEHWYSVQNIFLPWVITPRKSVKYGLIRGTIADWKMLSEVFSVISFREFFSQLWYFSRFHSWHHSKKGSSRIFASDRTQDRDRIG